MSPIRTLIIAKGDSSLGIFSPPSAPNFSEVGCFVLMPVLLSVMFQECHQSLLNTASRKEERGCSKNSEDKGLGCLGTVPPSCIEEGWVMHSVLFWPLSRWLTSGDSAEMTAETGDFQYVPKLWQPHFSGEFSSPPIACGQHLVMTYDL